MVDGGWRMTVDLRELRNEVLRNAPEAPLSLVVDLLRESAREFFARSQAWRETFTIPLVADQTVYRLFDADNDSVAGHLNEDDEFDTEVVGWHEVVYNETAIPKWTDAKLHRNLPLSETGIWAFSCPNQAEIKLYGIPGDEDEGELLTVTVSLRPARNRRFIVNDDIVDMYKDDIVAGALARLFVMPRQPWTDLSLVPYHTARFEDAIRAADNRAQTQHARHVVRIVGYGGI